MLSWSWYSSPSRVDSVCEALWRRCSEEARTIPAEQTQHVHQTPFHAVSLPTTPLRRMLTALQARIQYEAATLPVALVLLERYWRVTGDAPSPYAIHRLLATCLLVACKLQQDFRWNNKHFATACGIRASDLNRMEVALLESLRYDIFVHAEEAHDTIDELSERRPGKTSTTISDSASPFLLPSPYSCDLNLETSFGDLANEFAAAASASKSCYEDHALPTPRFQLPKFASCC